MMKNIYDLLLETIKRMTHLFKKKKYIGNFLKIATLYFPTEIFFTKIYWSFLNLGLERSIAQNIWEIFVQ